MSDDERTTRMIQQILEKLNDPTLRDDQRSKLESELARLGRVIDPPCAYIGGWLVKPPMNMDAVYRRRAELDQRLFG